MKPASRKSNPPNPYLRPSQSLHSRFLRSHPLPARPTPQLPQLTLCILYKKRKIQFHLPSATPFAQVTEALYAHLHRYLAEDAQVPPEKAHRILRSIVGWESVDGDVNFDYRLSLQKGSLQQTKFLAPFGLRSQEGARFKIYHCLAIGGFSKVYLGRSYEDGQFYAIKFIRKSGEGAQEKYQSLRNQMRVSQQLEHPFLVRLLQAFETAHFYCMVFEYCPGGELFYLLKRVKVMPEPMAKFYFLQILYGIQYLHGKSIVYRDLKPENILIDADGNCKIVDFGLSKRIDPRAKTFSYCGSAEYMAPEMILRSGHSFAIDYYSLGALLYELVTGLPPYYTKNHDELQESIICKQISFPPHVPLSSEIKDLLERLLKKEEKYRLGSYVGIKEILFHPWVGKVNAPAVLAKQLPPPHAPKLEDYNFDTSELGDDEQEFTALVHEDINREAKKQTYYQEFYKSTLLTNYSNPILNALFKSVSAQNREDTQPSKDLSPKKEQKESNSKWQKQNSLPRSGSLARLKNSMSKEKLKEIMRSHNNVLEKLQKNDSKEKSMRANNTVEQRRTKEIYKLYPYLNCRQNSPSKQQQILNFIENRIIKVERPQQTNKLKRMRIERNKLETEQL